MINAKEAAEMLKNMAPENKAASLEKRISALVLSKLDSSVKLAISHYRNRVNICLSPEDAKLDPAIIAELRSLDPDNYSYRINEKDIEEYLLVLNYRDIKCKVSYSGDDDFPSFREMSVAFSIPA